MLSRKSTLRLVMTCSVYWSRVTEHRCKPFHDYSLCSVCILPQPAFYSQTAVCILHTVCILPPVRILRFTLTAFSTVRERTTKKKFMQMYTGTRLTTAIHRRLLSRFFLREGDVCTQATSRMIVSLSNYCI